MIEHKEMTIINERYELITDISQFITKWTIEGDGKIVITPDNVLDFQHELNTVISKYDICEKGVIDFTIQLQKDYKTLVSENNVSRVTNEERLIFNKLLVEKCKELEEVKRKLSEYEK